MKLRQRERLEALRLQQSCAARGPFKAARCSRKWIQVAPLRVLPEELKPRRNRERFALHLLSPAVSATDHITNRDLELVYFSGCFRGSYSAVPTPMFWNYSSVFQAIQLDPYTTEVY